MSERFNPYRNAIASVLLCGAAMLTVASIDHLVTDQLGKNITACDTNNDCEESIKENAKKTNDFLTSLEVSLGIAEIVSLGGVALTYFERNG